MLLALGLDRDLTPSPKNFYFISNYFHLFLEKNKIAGFVFFSFFSLISIYNSMSTVCFVLRVFFSTLFRRKFRRVLQTLYHLFFILDMCDVPMYASEWHVFFWNQYMTLWNYIVCFHILFIFVFLVSSTLDMKLQMHTVYNW